MNTAPLHSTMLLLNRHISKGVCCDVFLYIPLCFYLIPLTVRQRRVAAYLYIPLCFYLICERHRIKIPTLGLYIPLCFYLIQVRCFSLMFRYLPLHSTMLLLNHSSERRKRNTRSSFTFHYAST